jgi:hypothetical protein
MQCNVEFGYELSICSGTKENLDRVGRSQDLPEANWLLASSLTLNMWALTLVPICAVAFFNKLFLHIFYVHIIWMSTKQCITPAEWMNAYMNKYACKCTYNVFASMILWLFPPPPKRKKLTTQWVVFVYKAQAFLLADPSELAEAFGSF